MSERIEDFDDTTPREIYNRGYDDGLKRGMEIADSVKLQYQAIERHRDALISAITGHNMLLPPHPIVMRVCDIGQLSDSEK